MLPTGVQLAVRTPMPAFPCLSRNVSSRMCRRTKCVCHSQGGWHWRQASRSEHGKAGGSKGGQPHYHHIAGSDVTARYHSCPQAGQGVVCVGRRSLREVPR